MLVTQSGAAFLADTAVLATFGAAPVATNFWKLSADLRITRDITLDAGQAQRIGVERVELDIDAGILQVYFIDADAVTDL